MIIIWLFMWYSCNCCDEKLLVIALNKIFKKKLTGLYKWNSNPYGWHSDRSLWAVSFPQMLRLAIFEIKGPKETSQDYLITILAYFFFTELLCCVFYWALWVIPLVKVCKRGRCDDGETSLTWWAVLLRFSYVGCDGVLWRWVMWNTLVLGNP